MKSRLRLLQTQCLAPLSLTPATALTEPGARNMQQSADTSILSLHKHTASTTVMYKS